MKTNNLILFLLILISAIFLILSLFPNSNNALQGGTTYETTTLSITIFSQENDRPIGENGHYTPNNSLISNKIPNITALIPGTHLNLSIFGAEFPSSWMDAREPNSTEVGTTKIDFFEIKINYTTTGGNYRIYFNLSSSELVGLNANNISLFIFNETNELWENLSTFIVNSSTNFVLFYGITPHFSKFVVGEKPSAEASVSSGSSDSNTGTGSGGGGGGSSTNKLKPITEQPSIINLPSKTVHKPSHLFDVSIKIPKKYLQLIAGEELIAEINIINLNKNGPFSTKVTYQIQDAQGKIVYSAYENLIVENVVSYIKEMVLPEDLLPGDYQFITQVGSEPDMALAGNLFEVIGDKPPLVGLAAALTENKTVANILQIMATVIIVIILAIYFMQRNKPKNRTRRR